MKRIVLGFTAALVLAVIFLFFKGSKMTEISTEIEISATPEKVWGILTDIEAWQQWSPIINASSGNAAIGEKLTITMMGKNEGQDGPKYNPEIKELRPNEFFRWRAHMMAGFLFTNDKVFELQKTAAGTKLVHKELFSGMLAPIFCGAMEKGVPPMLNKMNQALKELAEKHSI